ncbi:MAG: retropepsin-like aspartic protease family protein [Notoacmeibacter sp.]
MIKHTIFFGGLIGMAVAVPLFYQNNPDLFRNLTRSEPNQVAFKVEPEQKTSNGTSLLGNKVAIPMDERGHFQTDFKLNGRKVMALVDTGATYVAINRSTASRIGLKITTQDMKFKVTTANGQTPAASVVINEVAIGKIRVNNVPALVLDDKALDGILMGMSFLKELDKFSIENRTLILQQ